MHLSRFALAAAGLALSLPAVSAAANPATPFDKLPAEKAGKSSPLLVGVVDYAGHVNGSITVDVQNPTDAPQEFTAKGLYFVPQGNPDQAPQRLGAVGPFRLESANDRAERLEHLTIPPKTTERLVLEVYCIDSHRPSPSPSTPFRIAKDRVPPSLTEAIDKSARTSAAPVGGISSNAPAAKAAVQSEVWKNRDAKWIKLDGEGKQEAAKH